MSWHYRAGRKTLPDGSDYYVVIEWYSPHEMFGKGKKRAGWTDEITPGGVTKQELIEDLEMMLADVKRHKAFTLGADEVVNDLQPSDTKASDRPAKAQ